MCAAKRSIQLGQERKRVVHYVLKQSIEPFSSLGRAATKNTHNLSIIQMKRSNTFNEKIKKNEHNNKNTSERTEEGYGSCFPPCVFKG